MATCSRTPTPDVASRAHGPDVSERFLHEAVDLSDREACERFVRAVMDRFGRIDVLVNNAGIARHGVLPTFAYDEIDEVIDLNLRATIQITKLVSRRMLRQRSGRIINISSIVGLSGYRGLSVYSATKAALDGFTRALARELGSRGITVNSVAPGYLRTAMWHGLDASQLKQIVRRTPAGRLGEPADIAATGTSSWRRPTPASSPARCSLWTAALRRSATQGLCVDRAAVLAAHRAVRRSTHGLQKRNPWPAPRAIRRSMF